MPASGLRTSLSPVPRSSVAANGELLIHLGDEPVDAAAIADRLNGLGGVVVAQVKGDIVVVRPVRAPTLSGISAFYSGRPEFQGRVERAGQDFALRGSLYGPDAALALRLGAVVVGLGGIPFGSIIVRSGDVSGWLAIVISTVISAGLLIATKVVARLIASDEKTIREALDAVSAEDIAGLVRSD